MISPRQRFPKDSEVVARITITLGREMLVPTGTRGVVTRAPTKRDPTVGVRFENGRSLWVHQEELRTATTARRVRRARRKTTAQKAIRRQRAISKVTRSRRAVEERRGRASGVTAPRDQLGGPDTARQAEGYCSVCQGPHHPHARRGVATRARKSRS